MKSALKYRIIGFLFLTFVLSSILPFILDESGLKKREQTRLNAITNSSDNSNQIDHYTQPDQNDTLPVTANDQSIASSDLTQTPTTPQTSTIKIAALPQPKTANQLPAIPQLQAATKKWELQIATFSSKANAQKMQKRLKNSIKQTSYIKTVKRNNKNLYLLFVNGWDSKKDATKAKRIIDFEHNLKTVVRSAKKSS